MYCDFFGFSEKPFDVTPDPKFLYQTKAHREMLAALIYGIHERRGFITIMGEVGTGKTTLLNTVLGRLDEKTQVAYISNTDVTFEQMLTMALVDWGLARSDETPSKVEAVHRLNDFAIRQLANGGNVVLIVDEAQNLDNNCMENFRLLSNLETRKRKLIQIILSGQPELDSILRRPALRQLAQRISLRRYITALSEEETYKYIQHRLGVANYKGTRLFNRRARQMIWEYSEGVPRKINILCDNAFITAYGLQKKTIKARVIEECIRDLSWSPFSAAGQDKPAADTDKPTAQLKEKTSRFRFSFAACLVLVACSCLVVGILLGRLAFNRVAKERLFNHTVRRTGIQNQPDGSNQSRAMGHPASQGRLAAAKGVALAHDAQGDSGPRPGAVEGDGRGNQAMVVPSAIQALELPESREEAQGVPAESETSNGQIVVVEKGDSLSKIIIRTYGEYNGSRLGAVLTQNPEIQNPDYILVDQVIKLPVTTELD